MKIYLRRCKRFIRRNLRLLVWASVVVLGLITLYISYRVYEPWSTPSYEQGADCLPGETYDGTLTSCMSLCTSTDTCAIAEYAQVRVIDSLSSVQLQRLFGFYLSTSTSVMIDTDRTSLLERSAEMTALARALPHTTYTIVDGHIAGIKETVLEPDVEQAAYQMWTLFSLLAPDRYLSRISSLKVLDSKYGDMGMAVFYPMAGVGWELSIDKTAFLTETGHYFAGATVHTIIHEIGHIATLDSCDEHCPLLDPFLEEFWPDYDIEAAFDDQSAEFGKQTLGVYQPSMYVSEYASEDPLEDIAESFAAFVLLPRQEGRTIAEKKINYFYRYPQFVAARTFMRDRITRIF